ncbi:ketopantoate reductase family protein [Paenibacillus crassostreae]|uniref:2-dehydropantoate 2-reductase n=1 Tax=Paenibacillus crassostreae TaxID=1763538 RepID=A0A167C3E2_9BACL|nr:2-dehydropantoate 2-reductase [Paenibacillus crassostreae]AOZ91693.1 hypothetical protein LPB68_05310 [Paenibacillus crassostreae]OAB72734.1 hypothetical protein PNBC_14940 [Paenibacillus crassostreae]
MKIDIIGGGSLGLLFAGKLASVGNEVRVWCRGQEQAVLLNSEGILINSNEGSSVIELGPLAVEAGVLEESISKWDETPSDWIFLMTKQKEIEKVVSRILTRLDYNRLVEIKGILCFQNGVGHIELLKGAIPHCRIYSAITTEAARKDSHNKVFHAGHGMTMVGSQVHKELEEGMNSDIDEKALLSELQKAGFQCDLSKEIVNHMYRKLLINAVINPLTAIWRIQNGELLVSSQRIDLMRKLFDEGIEVYNACGIVWDIDLWDQIMNVCKMTSSNTSSMYKDVKVGHSTEIQWINGSIVSLAESQGIHANYHQMMVELIEGMKEKEE